MRTTREVNLLEAMDMTDMTEDELGRLAEEGNLKVRRVGANIYFDVESVEQLVERTVDEARKGGECQE